MNLFMVIWEIRILLLSASKGIDNVVILGGLVGDPITKKYPDLSTTINEIGIKIALTSMTIKN